MKVVIKPLGGLAITIFIIFLILPLIYTYYNYYKIPKFQLFYFIIINLLFIASLVYSFIIVANSDKSTIHKYDILPYHNEKAIYMLFTEGGFKNFQIWFAAISNNAWLDILFSILIFMIPFPLLPASPLGRLELMLSKLGLYKIALALILGNPTYKQKDNYFSEFDVKEKIEMGISLGLLIIFIIYIIYDLMMNFKSKKK